MSAEAEHVVAAYREVFAAADEMATHMLAECRCLWGIKCAHLARQAKRRYRDARARLREVER